MLGLSAPVSGQTTSQMSSEMASLQNVQLENMVGSSKIISSPSSNSAASSDSSNYNQVKTGDAAAIGLSNVNFEAAEYKQSILNVPGLQLPWQVPMTQMPEGGYFVRDPLSGVHQGYCTMADVPMFLRYAKDVFGYYAWDRKPFTIGADGQVQPVSLTRVKNGKLQVLRLVNTTKFRRTGPFKWSINVKEPYLYRPADERVPRVWVEAALDHGVAFDLPTLMKRYYFVGQVAVIGDQGILSSKVIDFAKGLALIGHVDVAFLTNSVLLKNSTLAIQPGMSIAGATTDIGLGGLLAAVIGEAKMKGNQWAVLWLFTEIPAGRNAEGPPAGVRAAYKTNGNGNGNGKPIQEVPPEPILTRPLTPSSGGGGAAR